MKERIRKLNKKTQASPGKYPLMKQQMIELYFKRKSPKALKARGSPKASKATETGELEPEDENKKPKGASNSPLLGVSDHLGPIKPLPSARSPSPESEERGRTRGLEAKKKALKALVKWPPDPEPSPKSLKKGKLRKRLQRGTSDKATRDGPRQEGSNVLKKWLQREKEGSETSKTGLGPRKATETANSTDGE